MEEALLRFAGSSHQAVTRRNVRFLAWILVIPLPAFLVGDHPKFCLPTLFKPRWTCILKYDVFSAASMKYPVQLEDWRSIPVHLFRSRALNLPGNTLSVSKWSLDQNVKSFCWDLSQEQCIISDNFRTTLCPTQALLDHTWLRFLLTSNLSRWYTGFKMNGDDLWPVTDRCFLSILQPILLYCSGLYPIYFEIFNLR